MTPLRRDGLPVGGLDLRQSGGGQRIGRHVSERQAVRALRSDEPAAEELKVPGFAERDEETVRQSRSSTGSSRNALATASPAGAGGASVSEARHRGRVTDRPSLDDGAADCHPRVCGEGSGLHHAEMAATWDSPSSQHQADRQRLRKADRLPGQHRRHALHGPADAHGAENGPPALLDRHLRWSPEERRPILMTSLSGLGRSGAPDAVGNRRRQQPPAALGPGRGGLDAGRGGRRPRRRS